MNSEHEHEAALSQFHQVDSCHLKDPAKFALQLLSVSSAMKNLGGPIAQRRKEGRF